MYKNKKILAVITARGGSKRIPQKNIKLLAGKPLIAYVILAAKESDLIDRFIVSTDSPQIAKIAKKYGAETPFLRPKTLARDNTPSMPVLKHAVAYLEKKGWQAHLIILLQPTAPLLTAEDINKAVKKIVETNALSCATVCPISQRPEWMYRLHKKKLDSFIKPAIVEEKRSQDLPKLFVINGAVYVVKRNVLMKKNKILDKNNLTAVIMPQERSIDIDEPLDFKIAEFLIKKKTVLKPRPFYPKMQVS